MIVRKWYNQGQDVMKARKRMGRPLKAPEPGKRMSLGLKVTPQIKEKLDRAARENGRTQSQEAEIRLEQSFNAEDRVWQSLEARFGARQAGLLLMIGDLMRMAGIMAIKSEVGAYPDIAWLNQHNSVENARDAVSRFLTIVIPTDDRPRRDEGDLELDRGLTEETIRMWVEEISGIKTKDGDEYPDLRRWAKQMRDLLGDELAKRLLENVNKETD
jgi:hypothetical protein